MIQQDNFLQAMQYILYHERVTFMWEEVKTSEKEWKVSPTVYVFAKFLDGMVIWIKKWTVFRIPVAKRWR